MMKNHLYKLKLCDSSYEKHIKDICFNYHFIKVKIINQLIEDK